MPFALSRLERIYLQAQATFNALPHTGGAATVGNANACRFIRATLDTDVATIMRPDKTGSRSDSQGAAGRKFGKWSVEMSLSPNGTPAVKPDADVLLQGLMGQVGAVTTATALNGFPTGTTVIDGAAAYKYTLSDSIVPFCVYSFRQPSTVDQRVAAGACIQRAVFNLGQDGAATWTAEGEAKWILSSNQFAAADTDMKCGLSAFPVEPGAPVTNGNIVVGFTGRALVDGATLSTLRTATVNVSPGNVPVRDTFGTFTAQEMEGDLRAVSTAFSIYEDDSAAFASLVEVAHDKTPIECVYQIGTVPGNTVVIHLKGVQLNPPARAEERRFIANFPDSPAKGSSVSAKDEITIWFV